MERESSQIPHDEEKMKDSRSPGVPEQAREGMIWGGDSRFATVFLPTLLKVCSFLIIFWAPKRAGNFLTLFFICCEIDKKL